MNICDECGEVHSYDYGDFVQLAQNPMVKGQVVGERNWDNEYNVRLIGLLKTEWFHAVELEPDPDFALAKAAALEAEREDDEENVIKVDFKKAGGMH